MLLFQHCLIAWIATLGLLYILRPLAFHVGLLDHPKEHKQHAGTIPLIGGIAMFSGVLLAIVSSGPLFPGWFAFILASVSLVAVGVWDDLHDLPTSVRFVVQIAAALIMTFWGEVSLQNLGNLVDSDTIFLGDWSVPLTVFATVGVINAINMIDGMDGLAGSLVFILLLCLSVLCFSSGMIADSQFLLVVAMAVSAFLVFNIRWPGRQQARVFMGDAGSLFLGLVVAWFLIKLSQQSPPVIAPVTALWLFAVPLMDTVGLILRRLAKGRSPFAAGREHLHHIFLAAGFTISQTLMAILLISIVLGSIGLAAAYIGVAEPIMFWSFMTLFMAYLIISVYAWQRVSKDQNNATPVEYPVRPVEAKKP